MSHLPLLSATLGFAATVLAGSALAQASQNPPPDEPKLATYALDIEAKLLTDRRNRGISDSYNRPGAQVTFTFAHETGMIALLELGSVSKDVFPESNGLLALAAVGYRWGKPNGWHFGAGIARELFPKAVARDLPTGFDFSTGEPTGLVTTRFHTTYLVAEFGYKLLEGRYLYVSSEDLRGNNTAVLCGSAYLPGLLAGADPTKAINCYSQGFKHSRGSHLLDFDIKYPISGQTKLTAHLGFQKLHNFRDGDLFDYKFGAIHTVKGFDIGLEVIGASLRNRDLAIITEASGKTRRLDQTALLLSIGKRF